LDQQLDNLQDYRTLFDNRKFNLVKTTSIGASVVGGVLVFGMSAGLGAPAYAAAMGKAGFLGLASTEVAISSLSGAALTSASLAAIGGGGIAFITATGAAIGGVIGGVVANQYVGEIKGFDIIQYNEGDDTSVIFVNGFLNQDNDDIEDWRPGARKAFKSKSWYLTKWESKKKASIGKAICGNVGKAGAGVYFTNLAKQATRKAGSKIHPLTMGAVIADLLGNDWHSAMAKAAMTGILLADLMSRTPGKKYILVGHSLGTRVIYYALEALSTRTTSKIVEDVILMGGAVGADDQAGWKRAAHAVTGTIHNCYSTNDGVLKAAYRSFNAFLSEPIGLREVAFKSRKIKNWDCSSFINGHTEWKPRFDKVLDQIKYV
jgi:hypothetical protein